jgi:hypothetical protein
MGTKVAQEPSAACSRMVGKPEVTKSPIPTSGLSVNQDLTEMRQPMGSAALKNVRFANPLPTSTDIKRELPFLAGPDSCPPCPLCGCNSLASCRRNGSLFPTRFPRAQVDLPKCREGSGYAVQFILKSSAFLLELTGHRLDQCLWHRAIFITRVWTRAYSPTSDFDFSLGGLSLVARVDGRHSFEGIGDREL